MPHKRQEKVYSLDLTDRKILCELEEDCRQSLQQIARKLRLSRTVVDYRIKRLNQEGVIEHYISTLNLGKLGYKTYKIYLNLSYSPENEWVEYLLKSSQVLHCLKTEGEYDYIISVASKGIKDLDAFLSELKTRFKDLIRDYAVSIVVYTRIFKVRKLLLGEKKLLPKMHRYSGEEEKIDLDEKDKSILRCISQQANLSLIEISRKTGLSLDIVKYRLQQLNKNIILSNRILLNFNRIGYYHHVILLKIRRASLEEENKLVSWCASQPSVLYCSKRIGQYDFEINPAIKDIGELNSLLEQLKKEFYEIIDSHEVIIISKLLKLNYIPF